MSRQSKARSKVVTLVTLLQDLRAVSGCSPGTRIWGPRDSSWAVTGSVAWVAPSRNRRRKPLFPVVPNPIS